MSDENEKQWREYSLENRSKIKKLEELKSYLDKGGLIEQLILNIETMEKTWDQNIVDALTQVTVALDKRDERISELEAVIGQKSWYKKDIGSIIDYLEKDIAELRENCKMCKDCNLYPFRDSGGEKEIEEFRDKDGKLIHIRVKPPEPYWTEKELHPREDDIRMIEVEGNMYWMPKMDMYHNIIVKREDLQRWKFFLEKYNFHDDVKRIKEEYNL